MLHPGVVDGLTASLAGRESGDSRRDGTQFQSALEPARAADGGRWPGTADPSDPAAAKESSTARGGQESPAAAKPNSAAAGLLPSRFVLDEVAFMNDIEPLPAFLHNPSPEYLRANEMMPMLAVLAGH